MTNADKAILDDIERRILPQLERSDGSTGLGDHQENDSIRDAGAAVAALQPCLQVRTNPLPNGEAPAPVNANVMRRAQDAEDRLATVIARLSGDQSAPAGRPSSPVDVDTRSLLNKSRV